MGREGGGIHNGVRTGVVSQIAGDRWEDDEVALEEIDMLTSSVDFKLPLPSFPSP